VTTDASRPGPARDPDAGADEPTDLPASSWWATLKRTVSEFQDDNLTDWAAALTYYAVLAIFPALIAMVSILGLVGDSATQPLLDNLSAVAPGPAKDIFTSAIENITANQGSAGLALVFGVAGALWSASGYIGAFSRASNAIYEVEEGRPFWKLKPFQILITALMIVLLAVCAIAVVVTGPLAQTVGDLVGAGDAAVTVWEIAKWPVIILVVITLFAILYWAAPNVKQPGFHWITPGGVLAVVLWIAVSALFAFYVSQFSSYNKTYGTLAGPVIFLVWLWLTNIAMLLGAELNAELERSRELEAGVPPEETIALEPRQAPNDDRSRGSPLAKMAAARRYRLGD
jgi:membrane protein